MAAARTGETISMQCFHQAFGAKGSSIIFAVRESVVGTSRPLIAMHQVIEFASAYRPIRPRNDCLR